jgi:hypothetical protein
VNQTGSSKGTSHLERMFLVRERPVKAHCRVVDNLQTEALVCPVWDVARQAGRLYPAPDED